MKLTKILALLLAVAMIFVMAAGCGSKEEAPADTPADTPATNAPAEPPADTPDAPADEPAEEPAEVGLPLV